MAAIDFLQGSGFKQDTGLGFGAYELPCVPSRRDKRIRFGSDPAPESSGLDTLTVWEGPSPER